MKVVWSPRAIRHLTALRGYIEADNNPKAAYVVYDMDEGTIELRRLEYDIPTAQRKILEAGLPPRLAERLAFGR